MHMTTRRKSVALYAVTECRTQGVFALAAQPWAGDAKVSLQTKKIKGLHENDFIMAAKIDKLANGRVG